MNVVAIHMPLHVSLLMGARVFLAYILGKKVAMMEVNALTQNGNFDMHY